MQISKFLREWQIFTGLKEVMKESKIVEHVVQESWTRKTQAMPRCMKWSM